MLSRSCRSTLRSETHPANPTESMVRALLMVSMGSALRAPFETLYTVARSWPEVLKPCTVQGLCNDHGQMPGGVISKRPSASPSVWRLLSQTEPGLRLGQWTLHGYPI